MARLVLRRDNLAKLRRLAGINTDTDFAKRIGMNKGQVSRVLRGGAPGPKFIANTLELFGIDFFQELFTVEPDDEGNAA